MAENKNLEAVQEETAVRETQEALTTLQHSNVSIGFTSAEGFALLQRMSKMFAASSLVPEHFRGQQNVGNCAIALNMAQRLGADPLMVMQNLYVVYGNPGWSSKFLIAMFNQCGRYTSIKYKETGKRGTDTQGIIAYATEKLTGEVIEGPEVTIAIAKKEGWYAKNGSKWQTMPDQMLRYRAAAWMIRTTAPELSMGLQTTDEIIDITPDPIDTAKKEIHENANAEVFEPKPAAKELPQAEVKVDAKIEPPKEAAKVEAPKAAAPAADGPGF